MNDKEIIDFMESLGYQKFAGEHTEYFLPIKKKMKFNTPITLEKIKSRLQTKTSIIQNSSKLNKLKKVHN